MAVVDVMQALVVLGVPVEEVDSDVVAHDFNDLRRAPLLRRHGGTFLVEYIEAVDLSGWNREEGNLHVKLETETRTWRSENKQADRSDREGKKTKLRTISWTQ